jgi:hypothetical protein
MELDTSHVVPVCSPPIRLVKTESHLEDLALIRGSAIGSAKSLFDLGKLLQEKYLPYLAGL